VTILPRVLIVEDEAGLRLTLTDRLTSEGYAVETAEDGEAGLERAATGAYDLIVLDVMLPRMNGFDVCREVRRRGVTTPVLMLTARGQVVDKVVGLKLGADDYLTKPFETMELMARLEALLRRRAGAQVGTDTYRCPGGKQLKTTGTAVNDGTTLLYRASKHDCQPCALKPRCCPKEPARKVPRSIYEGARDLARVIATTDAYAVSRRQRKKVEMLFAHLKRILRLDRLRLRGPTGARDEFLLAATAQNLRKLAKLIPVPMLAPAT